MFSRICYYLGILSCIGLIAACFMPWVHVNVINETITGFHAPVFPTKTTYGRAGIPLTFFASIILLLMLIPKLWAKRINLFVAALLLAYTIRVFILFTGQTFQGEIDVKAGIYVVLLSSIIIMIAAIFPYIKVNKSIN